MIDWMLVLDIGTEVAIVALAALVLLIIASIATRVLARRWPKLRESLMAARRRFGILVLIVAAWIAAYVVVPSEFWNEIYTRVLLIVVIATAAWTLNAVVAVGFDGLAHRYITDDPDDRLSRRARTQLTVLKRLSTALLVVIAVAVILLTFPGAQAAGASLLASAGVLSVVAGIAAQSSLGNVFAGMQLAFSDAIRLGDVVIVEGEFGKVEEITLTYVVVGVWDQRRLVLPSTYFTENPFENWTRTSAELMGTVELDVDWRVDLDAMRTELQRIVAANPLWDGRAASIVATDARGGLVRVRPLVSARDASELWDLRCDVREGLVAWVRKEHPEALPVQRVLVNGFGADRDAAADGQSSNA